MTQEALASSIDRSVDAVSALERGVALPSFEMLARLADVLKVPLASFFDERDGTSITTARAAKLARLTAEAARLSDAELEVAVEQVAVFNRLRRT